MPAGIRRAEVERSGISRTRGEEATIFAPEDLSERTFETIYRRYYWSLVGFCRARVTSAAAAEDAAQESFIRAFRYLHGLDPTRPSWPWLKTIARNVLADRAARDSRETLVQAPEDAPAAPAWSVEERMVLRQAMAGLPRRHRVALTLRYLQGWEPRAAAAFLKLSVPAFNQLVFRARTRLKEELRKLGETVPAILLAPVRWLRGRSHRAHRLSEGNAAIVSRISTELLAQLATGLVAALLVAGGGPDPALGSQAAEPRPGSSAAAVADVAPSSPPPAGGAQSRPSASSAAAGSPAAAKKQAPKSALGQLIEVVDDATPPKAGNPSHPGSIIRIRPVPLPTPSCPGGCVVPSDPLGDLADLPLDPDELTG